MVLPLKFTHNFTHTLMDDLPLESHRVKELFHGGNTGSNPVGDAKSFQQLTVSPPPLYRHKKGTILGINANAFH
jgi:hypothetical protein